MGVDIRAERPEDFSEIYSLVKTAFATAKVADGDEQEFVGHLRERAGYIPKLALVAVADGRLVGHVMLTKTILRTADGDLREVLLLAPLSVLLEYRSKGIGAELVREVCRRAVGMGYKAVFLAGDPEYYSRFGFRTTADFGIKNDNGIPDQYALALELVPDALKGSGGSVEIT